MSEVKVSLTIILPGRVMVSKEESKKNKDLMDFHAITVVDKKNRKEVLRFATRKCIPAKQVMSISKEAYKDMIGSTCPVFSKQKDWGRLKKTMRLEAHFKNITEALGGIEFTYKVFED